MGSQGGGEAETVLRLSNITKRFGPLTANDSVSFELKRGEVIALLGENGAGKTTLMNILFGHYVADEGSVEAFGRALPPGDPRAALDAGIGMVHQHFTLADNMSVLENIALGTQSFWKARFDRAGARRRIVDLSSAFGLAVDPDASLFRGRVRARFEAMDIPFERRERLALPPDHHERVELRFDIHSDGLDAMVLGGVVSADELVDEISAAVEPIFTNASATIRSIVESVADIAPTANPEVCGQLSVGYELAAVPAIIE